MKVCPKCKKEYPDQQNFCNSCGVQLETFSAGTENNRKPEVIQSAKQFPEWLCAVLGIAGVFVGWEMSALLGFVLGFIGASMGSKSENALMKWTSYICCGITVLFLAVVTIFD